MREKHAASFPFARLRQRPAPRLLFVITALHTGGAQRHLAEIVPGLIAAGFKVRIFVLKADAELDDYRNLGAALTLARGSRIAKHFPFGIGAVFRVAAAILHFNFHLIAQRPDVVHAFLPEACILAVPCARVVGIRARIGSRRSLNDYQRNRRWAKLLERVWFSAANAILANSSAVRAQLVEEGAPARKIGVIYNAVDAKRFEFTVSERAERRNALGLAPHTLAIVVVANLIPYKGHRDLLIALGSISSSLPEDWTLVAAGRDDGAGPDLHQLAAELGLERNIRWFGPVARVETLLKAADLLVLPSHQEGFPNSIIEGMAAGLPIVATDVGGVGEAISNGSEGLLVPAHRPDLLGQAIAVLASNGQLRSEMGQRAREKARRDFALEPCIERYVRLYRALGHLPGSASEQVSGILRDTES